MRSSGRRRPRPAAPRRSRPTSAGRGSRATPSRSREGRPRVARGSGAPAGGAAASRSTTAKPISASASAAASRSRSNERTQYMWYTWPGLVGRQLRDVAEPELRVAGRGLTPGRVPAVELRQEDAQHRGLQRVEARVVADQLEVLLRPRAVEAQHADAVGELGVVDGDEPAVAEREQVLGREEAEGRGDRSSRSPAAPNACAASSMIGRPTPAELVERRRAGRTGAPA